MSELANKLEHLKTIIRQLERVAVAFSGGVDSALMLKVSADTLGSDNVIAVTARSASLPASELDDAITLAALIGVKHVMVDTDELSNPDYAANPADRCYYCKTTLYDHMQPLLVQHSLKAIINGTNFDDLGDYRPGLVAAKEFDVRSPAVEAKLTKQDIRVLSAELGLPTHDKPAAPCLSSRVQYGENITPEKLRMIESGEAFLKTLGIRECRVRHHGNLARIEVLPADLATLMQPETAEKVHKMFLSLGYTYVTLDLHGFRTGSMNEAIAKAIAPQLVQLSANAAVQL